MPKTKAEDIEHDCKVAYLLHFDDVNEKVKSKEKLTQLLQQVGRNPTKKMINKYWRENTVSLTFKDFCDICRKEPRTTEEELLSAFKKIDTNKDGFLTVSELQKILTSKGDKMKPSEIKAIISEVDENGDGKLDYKEFCKMVLKTQSECQKVAEDLVEKKLNKQQEQQAAAKKQVEKEKRRDDSQEDDSRGRKDSRAQERSKEQERSRSRERSPAPPERRDLKARPTSASVKKVKEELSSDDDDDEIQVVSKKNGTTKEKDSKRRPTMEEKTSRSGSRERTTDTEKTPLNFSKSKQQQKEKESADLYKRKDSGERSKPAAVVKDSEDSDDSDDDIVIGSTSSLRPASSSTGSKVPPPKLSRTSEKPSKESDRLQDDDTRGRKLDREEANGDNRTYRKPAVIASTCKLPRPKNIKQWKNVSRKGCFFFDDNGNIVGHQYTLKLNSDSSVYIQLEPLSVQKDDFNNRNEGQGTPVDTLLLVQNEAGKTVTLTDVRGPNGEYGVRCDLQKGRYRLVPFTSGCRFKKRKSEAKTEMKLLKEQDKKWIITKSMREALSTMFAMADMDCDGMLTRDEFSWFTLRTEGAEVDDEKWQVVEDAVKLEKNRLSLASFLTLMELEAEESQGDTSDFWVTLNNMGFNKGLQLDEACPFLLNTYTESTDALVSVVALESPNEAVDKALTDISKAKGQLHSIKQLKDVSIYTYATDFFAWLLIDNKSRSASNLEIDCSKSSNVLTSRKSLREIIKTPAGIAKVGHFIIPEKEIKEWIFTWKENAV